MRGTLPAPDLGTGGETESVPRSSHEAGSRPIDEGVGVVDASLRKSRSDIRTYVEWGRNKREEQP